MSRKLRILDEDDWFLGKDGCEGYPVSYRYALCYSLRRYLEKCDYDENRGCQALKYLRDAIASGANYSEKDFAELLPLKSGGFVVVDQADGMFPLVLYANSRDDVESRQRVSAYEKSLEDVMNAYNAIFRYFRARSTQVWDQAFQTGLWKAAGFAYPVNIEASA